MQYESEGPKNYDPTNYDPLRGAGASCPTPAYAKSLVAQIQCGQGTDCTKAPRQGRNEMAENQYLTITQRVEEITTAELIRAREIGQREGREDREREGRQEVAGMQKTIATLHEQLANALRQPIYFFDANNIRIAELEARNTVLQRLNDNQYALIRGYQEAAKNLYNIVVPIR